MIGHVIMEIEPDEMRAALAYYFNKDVFMTEGYPTRIGHKAVIVDVRQRSNGNFIVEFDGWRPAPKKQESDAETTDG